MQDCEERRQRLAQDEPLAVRFFDRDELSFRPLALPATNFDSQDLDPTGGHETTASEADESDNSDCH